MEKMENLEQLEVAQKTLLRSGKQKLLTLYSTHVCCLAILIKCYKTTWISHFKSFGFKSSKKWEKLIQARKELFVERQKKRDNAIYLFSSFSPQETTLTHVYELYLNQGIYNSLLSKTILYYSCVSIQPHLSYKYWYSDSLHISKWLLLTDLWQRVFRATEP